MTATQLLITIFILLVSVMVFMMLFEVLLCLDNGEYKKAVIVTTFVVLLSIIVFTGILVAF